MDAAHGLVNDFSLNTYRGGNIARLNSNNLNGRGLAQTASQDAWQFQNLSANFVVGPSMAGGYKFGSAGQSRWLVRNGVIRTVTAVGFTSGVNGYFGFSFTDGTNLFYGWAELNINAPANQFTINRWAYESCSGQGIAVGATSDGATCGVSNVPEPGILSLTLLGLGAGGVREWRRRRQAQALAA